MRTLITLFAITLLMASCAPIHQCGTTAPERKPMMSKRTEAVYNERNQLCSDLATEKSTTADLRAQNEAMQKEIEKKNAEVADLKLQYGDLSNLNLSQAAQFDETLKRKASELNEKEKLLSERERALAEMRAIIARQDSITQRLNDILRNALLGFDSEELQVEIKNGKVYVSMSDKLLFKSGSATVETKGKEAIKLLGDVLGKNTDIDVLIEGHTDNVPIKTAVYKDNWDLSVARATDIVRVLTNDMKIEPIRLTASGKGEFMPRATNDTPEGRARNRRTEIILSPKLDELMQLLNNK
ncbi:MAG: OmpA family protein [Flavobacteriales bacterium]|nr:OmpA family protein [Flavobacteriales bacterium]